MKKVIYFVTLLFSSFTFATTSPYSGEITAEDLLAQYPAFAKEYKSYSPSGDDLNTIKTLSGKQVLVFLGTWCHDSKREVPRLLKLLDGSGVKLGALQLIAVGYDKLDPDGLAKQYDLRYTPTFIVSSNGKELLRMIEKPKHSIAMDLTRL